jgi:hypothetical protein
VDIDKRMISKEIIYRPVLDSDFELLMDLQEQCSKLKKHVDIIENTIAEILMKKQEGIHDKKTIKKNQQ